MKVAEFGKWYKRHTGSPLQSTDIYFRPDRYLKNDFGCWYEGPCIVIGKIGDRDVCQIETHSKEYYLDSYIENKSAIKCRRPFKDLNKAIKNLKSLIFNETE